jgi:hypothetical protein
MHVQIKLAVHFLPHSGQKITSPTFAFFIRSEGLKAQNNLLQRTMTLVLFMVLQHCLRRMVPHPIVVRPVLSHQEIKIVE